MKWTYFTTAAVMLFAASAQAQSSQINGANQYGCIHKADFDKTNDYVAQNDKEAFKTFLGLGVATGVCVLFNANEPVVVAKRGLFTSKVRRKGSLTEYFISSDAVK